MIKFFGKIKQGGLFLINTKAIYEQLKGQSDCLVEITLTPKDQRSNGLNGYLHKVLFPGFRLALRSVGYNEVRTDAQAKLIIKKVFLTESVYNEVKQDYEDIIRDTSSLNDIEAAFLIDEVIQFCAEHMHFKIPYPNEVNSNPSIIHFLINKSYG